MRKPTDVSRDLLSVANEASESSTGCCRLCSSFCDWNKRVEFNIGAQEKVKGADELIVSTNF